MSGPDFTINSSRYMYILLNNVAISLHAKYTVHDQLISTRCRVIINLSAASHSGLIRDSNISKGRHMINTPTYTQHIKMYLYGLCMTSLIAFSI